MHEEPACCPAAAGPSPSLSTVSGRLMWTGGSMAPARSVGPGQERPLLPLPEA